MATISVLIPCYNQGHYLAQAIDSALGQTYEDIEVFVVDDGSTDTTREVALSFTDPRLRYILRENGGLSAARNTALKASTSPFVTFLDADDVFLPHKLALLKAYLDSNPTIGMVSGGVRVVDDNGRQWGERVKRPANLSLPGLLMANPFPVGGVLVRREWIDRVGVFDESLRACEDWDMWLRLALAGCQFDWVEQIVIVYRVHPGQMTREADRMRQASLATLDKFFSRPDLPPDLQAVRNQALASALLKASARAYSISNYAQAQVDLSQALELDPTLAKDDYRRLVDLFLGWADHPHPQAPAPLEYLQRVSDHLPADIASLGRALRRAMATVLLRSVFEGREDTPHLRRAALRQVIRYDPRWLLNRGVLSRLVTSYAPGQRTSGLL